jgi:1-acyl-sn-glycerol-3-phosphate acyltransferase
MWHNFSKFWTRVGLWLTRAAVRVEGQGNIPAGPVIFLQSPAQAWDGMATLGYLPGKFHFVYPRHLLNIPLLGWLERLCGFLALETDNITLMHDDVLAIVGKLKRGDSVVFFTDKNEVKGGVTFVALQTKLPVVPVRIERKGRQVTIKIGKALTTGNAADDHRHRQTLKAELQRALS